MNTFPETALYVPALRLKAGEIEGLSMLRDDVKASTRPRLIVPPRPERDSAISELFASGDSSPDAGRVVSRFWMGRTAFIDPTYLYEDFGEQNSGRWMPSIFDTARGANVNAVPVASLNDLDGIRVSGLISAVDRNSALALAIVIEQRDFVSANLRERVLRSLERLQIEPKQVSILLEFSDVDFSDPSVVSGVLEGAYEDVEAIGIWESVVFQGTSFPTKNPASPGASIDVPRNEWATWRKSVGLSPSTPNRIMFGDYAADNAIMRFKKTKVQAIRHLRYATKDSWLIVRSSETGKDADRMRRVSERIVESDLYAGRGFSAADDYIFKMAKHGAGPGTAKNWRAINTAHHISRVVRDLGVIKGISFSDKQFESDETQLSMTI